MIIRQKIAPLYLQFFICDSSLPENPDPDVERIRILFNGQCLSVPCAEWGEAETDLTVGSADEVSEAQTPQFEGIIPTPSRSLVFHDALLNELLAYPTPTDETRIRIWTDGLILPERIVVAIG